MSYKSNYTGAEIDEAVRMVMEGGSVDLTNYATKEELGTKVDKVTGKSLIEDTEIARLKDVTNYDDTEIKQNINAKADKTDVPTKTSQLTNDSGFITGFVETDPTIPSHVKNITTTDISNWNKKSDFSGSYNDLTSKPFIPTATSHLTNDSNFATETYVRNEIANAELGGGDTEIDLSGYATKDELNAKVDKVAGKSLISDSEITRLAGVTNYNDTAIQNTVSNLSANKLDKTGDASNVTVAFTQASSRVNLTTGEKLSITLGKIMKFFTDLKTVAFTGSYSDLSNKPTIPTVPTKVSAFENDKGYLIGYTETDPTVPSWAKASSKPTYTKSEVGLGNVDNVRQYSSNNPPPYPVTSVNGQTGNVTIPAGEIVNLPTTTVPIYTIWTGTQAQYEAITTKDPNTEYNIIEE